MSLCRSTPVAPWLLINQVANEIHRLQCMIDIEKQLIDDAQRDMAFYSQLLAQLDDDAEVKSIKEQRIRADRG